MSKLIANHPYKPFDYARLEKSLHGSFQESVKLNSNHRAICDLEYDFTYAQLDAASSLIAKQLLASSQSSDARIALLFDQGVLLTAAILGVLKAGGVYVPFDPGYPLEWNASMFGEAGCSIILCSNRHAELADMLANKRVEFLSIDDRCANYTGAPVAVDRDPEDSACIYFTSGSTGGPKGVCDTHRSVLHNVMRYTNALHISNSDCLSLIQSSIFSGTLSSLFGALLNGASLASLDIRRWGLNALPDWIQDRGITIFHSVPTIFRTLALAEVRYPRVRVIRLEGDQSSERDFRIYQQHFSEDCVLANGLGATECGLVRQYLMHKNSVVNPGALPLGYPVQDMEVLILDETKQPLARGEVGEIAVRSRFMAKGYLNRPELTNRRFIEMDGSDDRTYQTGDMGVIDEADCLHFHGRKDHNPKINGQHVEVAWIASVLESISGVQQAVAHIRTDDPSSPYLVGYLVSESDDRPSLESIRERLGAILPSNMMPARLMWLDEIPLTFDHKTDRKALPVPPRERPLLATKFVAPRDPDELRLAEIWEDLLPIRPIGIYDNLFDLGGNSLTAMLLINRIHSKFNVRISISAIFETPNIAGLSKEIVAQSQSRRRRNPDGPG